MLLNTQGIVRISSDIEFKYLPSSTSVAKFSVVGSEKYKENKKTCFIECSAFGALAEKVIKPFCKKGDLIYIEGKLNQENWTTQDGSKRSKHTITVDSVQLLGSKTTDGRQGIKQAEAHMPEAIPEIDIDDYTDEIPF